MAFPEAASEEAEAAPGKKKKNIAGERTKPDARQTGTVMNMKVFISVLSGKTENKQAQGSSIMPWALLYRIAYLL